MIRFWSREQRTVAFFAYICLGVFILFLVSAFFSFTEIRYSLFGRHATATVTKTAPAPLVSNDALEVSYAFRDEANQPHIETYLFESRPTVPFDAPFDILYLPGKPDSSKPAAERHLWAIPVFITMLSALLVALVLFFRRILKEVAAIN